MRRWCSREGDKSSIKNKNNILYRGGGGGGLGGNKTSFKNKIYI